MKIEKFGTVTEENGTLILDGFVVNGENVEYPSYEAVGVAIVSAFKEMVAQIDVRSPFFPKNYLSIHSESAAPPVAAGSVDTKEFRDLLHDCRIAWGAKDILKTLTKIVAHINAWGAQQREQGKAEQTAFLKECMDRGQAEFNRKWTEQKARAEKAEARAKELAAERDDMNEDLDLAKLDLERAQARIKSLEAQWNGEHFKSLQENPDTAIYVGESLKQAIKGSDNA